MNYRGTRICVNKGEVHRAKRELLAKSTYGSGES